MADQPKGTNGTKKIKKKSKKPRTSVESKTPPLPTSVCGIEDLVKRRDYLKKKIRIIEDNPKGNQTKKQKLSTEETKYPQQKHLYFNMNPSSSNDYGSSSESEDEETIINQRRQQRQKILDKFHQSTSRNIKDKVVVINKQKCDVQNINRDVNIVAARRTRQDEVVDMFSELNEFTYTNPRRSPIEEDRLADNVHDDKGYYCVRVGESLKNGRFVIGGLLGQGVFANVVRAHDRHAKNTNVAIKIVRKNDLILKNSIKEVALLKQINNADPSDKHHCVRLLGEFTQNGHLCIVLELLHMNLRSFIKTCNNKSGINLTDLKKYSIQLFLALKLLNQLKIIHADIKPDNILIDQHRRTLKLCDFGSATHTLDARSPYLVSRYYRAPEIILGAPYDNGVDIWSLACTIYEMATGNILFTGNSNNKMIKAFIDLKGKFPVRVIKKGVFKNYHFNQDNDFLLREATITGFDKARVIHSERPIRNLLGDLKKYCKYEIFDTTTRLTYLKDLIDKMTALDPIERLTVSEGLKHPFLCKQKHL